MKVKIIGEENGWLDAFNEIQSYQFKQNEIFDIDDEYLKKLENDIEYFNNCYALGEAIWLKYGEDEK